MSLSEAERHEIYESLKHTNGELVASYLMTINPPIAWASVATKGDIGHLDTRIDRVDARLNRVETRLDQVELTLSHVRANMATTADVARLDDGIARLDDKIARLDGRLDATQSRFTTWLLASQAGIAALIGTATTIIITVLR